MTIDLQTPVEFGALIDGSRRALRWWLAELAGFLPEAARKLFRQRTVVIDVGAETWQYKLPNGDSAPVPALAGELRAGLAPLQDQVCELRLAAQVVLERRLTLPPKALKRLSDAVGLQMERLSPLPLERTRWTARLFRDATGTRFAGCAIADSERLEPVVVLARDAGLRRFRICDVSGRYALHEEDHARQMRRYSVAGFVLTGVLSLAAIVIWDLRTTSARATALEARIAALQAEAEAVAGLRREVQSETALAESLAARLTGQSGVRLLAEATRLTPDDTWLTGLEIDKGRITVEGYGRTPAAVLSAIADSRSFSEATFDGALQRQIELGADRFVLRARIRAGSP